MHGRMCVCFKSVLIVGGYSRTLGTGHVACTTTTLPARVLNGMGIHRAL